MAGRGLVVNLRRYYAMPEITGFRCSEHYRVEVPEGSYGRCWTQLTRYMVKWLGTLRMCRGMG
jgi:hypothetical protein